MTKENMKQVSVTVQIGNSDDKLPQRKWALFILDTLNVVADFGGLHFSGGSEPRAQWQNYCLVAVGPEAKLDKLTLELKQICNRYSQESISLIVGQSEFVS